ncbi:MAG: hypothetical protein MR215_01200 [Bacteroidales bacterium]|nr:hypothetical protein [Bacteroidales bacterium]
MRSRYVLTLSLLCLLNMTAVAQFYTTGSDPISVRWMRFDSPLWCVDADSAARPWAALADAHLAGVAPKLYSDFPASVSRRHVSVVVHSRAAYSNGLVSWAPKRLEAYAYDTGADDCVPWVRHLMTHEYRHVVQMQSTISGFSRGLYALFGQQSVGLVTGLFVPRWVLEGDAVWAETNYTPGGRGRNALFLQQTRSLVAEGVTPSFSQAFFGSYARRVPDFYHLGYHVVTAVSDTFGNAVIGQALQMSGRLPFTFVPFQRSLRKQTSMRPFAAYRWAMAIDSTLWANEMSRRHDTPAHPLWHSVSDYEEALNLRPWSGGWVAYVSSPSAVAHFSVRDATGHELRRIIPSARNEEIFDIWGDTIIWSERRQHCRWANASESCLMMANLRTGQAWRVTHDADYHSPALSPDGQRVAAIASRADASHAVVVMRPDGSSCKTVLLFPAGWQVPEVRWSGHAELVAIVVCPDGKGVVKMGLDGHAEWLLPPAYRGVRDLCVAQGSLFFSMDSLGYSDVYRLRDGALTRLAQGRHGIRCPMPMGGDSLVVSRYGADGYTPMMINQMEADTCGIIPPKALITPADTTSVNSFRRIGPMCVNLLPNVHSWGPVVVDANSQTISPGLSIASQNTHGTVYFQAGVDFWGDNDDDRVFASATWDFLWPRLTFSGHWGHTDYDFVNKYIVKEIGKPDGVGEYMATVSVNDRVHHSDVRVGLSLPLTRNSGLWVRGITPSVSWRREYSSGLDCHIVKTPTDGRAPIIYDSRTADSKFICATFGISAHVLRRTAERDVGSRGGVSVSALYDAAPWGADYGGQFFVNAKVYAPGFGQHHQSSLNVVAQHTLPGSLVTSSNGGYSYRLTVSNRQPSPYGLSRRDAQTSFLFRAAYHLPLLNPDWEVGPVLFVKRLNLRLVGDYGLDRLWNGTSVYSTSGRWTTSAELWAETRLFLLPYPVNAGLRLTYLPDSQSLSSAFLFSVSFN